MNEDFSPERAHEVGVALASHCLDLGHDAEGLALSLAFFEDHFLDLLVDYGRDDAPELVELSVVAFHATVKARKVN